jgi:hypothetical protein
MGDVWKKDGSIDNSDTPYLHWWYDMEGRERLDAGEIKEVFTSTDAKEKPETNAKEKPETNAQEKPETEVPQRFFLPAETVKRKGKLPSIRDVKQVKARLQKMPTPPKETVVIGIVDVGIALGHRRFRKENGETRFLAAWQQAAKIDPSPTVPFGQELYERDINRLLTKYGGGDLANDLDEDAFNRETQLVAPERERGNRALDFRAAHGTHVLDLAAGIDPLEPDVGGPASEQDATPSDTLDPERHRIIAVNLPPRSVYGSAGNFLAFFAGLAVERILFLADTLWKLHYPKECDGGFPVVINFSFGMLAGPKDGGSPLELKIRDLIDKRNDIRKIPTRFVMPAGNNNLSRGNARKLTGSEGDAWRRNGTTVKVDPILSVPWRIFPSDYTSNFVEIWAKARNRNTGREAEEMTPELFRLWVTPPNAVGKLEVPKLLPGEYATLSNYARVYCYLPPNQKRAHFVVCVAPTIGYETANPEAPAGLWRISLRFPRKETGQISDIIQETTFTVQTDQSGLPHAVTGRQSYFDHCKYQTHAADGRVLDSYGPGEGRGPSGPNLEPWNKFGPVQRKGTQNALATWDKVIVVGGYRVSDDTPVSYSSTFDGNSRRTFGREFPSVLFPSDDGVAHFGLLAAGSKDGSVVALRGTSMASALATRAIAMALAGTLPGQGEPFADEDWLKKCAKTYWRKRPGMKRHNALKQGFGLVPDPTTSPVQRRG